MNVVKRIAVGCSLSVALALGASGAEQVLDVPANESPEYWKSWDVGGAMDLADADGVEFDFFCDNLTRFGDFYLRLFTGDVAKNEFQGFHIRFQPTECGKWCHIRLRKVDVQSRLRPCGSWADVRSVRLIGQRGEGKGAARVRFANLQPLRPARVDALVVLCESSLLRNGANGALNSWCVAMTRRQQDAFAELGISNVAMADVDLPTRGVPAGVKLVSFLMNSQVPDGTFAVLTNYMAHGGKVLWSRGCPKDVGRYLLQHPECGSNVLFSLDKNDNIDIPAYASRLEPVVTKLVPEFAAQAVRARAERTAAEEKVLAEIRAMPGASGEERILDCHGAYGPWPEKEGWDKVAKFAKDCGFDGLDVNVCTGPIAWYPSKVLRPGKEVAARGDAVEQLVNACHANGLKAIGWRCCFVLKDKNYPEIADEYEKAGRLTVDNALRAHRGFLCPVNPLNRQEDTAALAELAGKGVDAVALDFIRYLSAEYCCCATCRAAFEKELGKPVANWPADAYKDESKGGCLQRWRAFRVEAITSHIREIRAAIKAVNPKVELWSSCFPTASGALSSEGQDWTRWCREGLVDHLGMMDYSITPATFEGLLTDQRQYDLGGFRRVGPVFGPVRWNGAHTVAENALCAAKHLEAIRRQGYTTFGFFQLSEETRPVLEILAQGPMRK